MPRRRQYYFAFFVALTISAFLVSRVFVYDAIITHRGLTKEAAELYNTFASRKLTEQETSWLIQGSYDEDYPIRWMNHFYDPIHNIGFKGFNMRAKEWAQSSSYQTNFSLGDFSWQRAIYAYQQGDYERAFLALGHILHLLEDMTVPAHTRDDCHVDGDPYEQWARNNFQETPAKIIYFNNLDKYFDYLANYSNNNFYSKDTIESNFYNLPKLDFLFSDSDYIYSKIDDIKFRLLLKKVDLKTNRETYSIDDNVLHSDYFSLLAPKAIGAGAGVIKLFFEQTSGPSISNPTWLDQLNPLSYLMLPVGDWLRLGGKILSSLRTNLAGRGSTLASEVPISTNPSPVDEEANINFGQDPLSNVPIETNPVVVDEYNYPSYYYSYQPAAPASENYFSQEDLLSGFRSAPLAVLQDDKKTISSPIGFSGGGSSGSGGNSSNSDNIIVDETPPALTTNNEGSSFSSTTENNSSDSTSSTPPINPARDTTPPVPVVILDPQLPIICTTSSVYVIQGQVSADTFKVYSNNQYFLASSSIFFQEVALAEGKNIFNFVAADLSDNKSVTTTVEVVKDATAPDVAIKLAGDSEQRTKMEVSWQGDDGKGAGVENFDVEFLVSTSTVWQEWISETTSTQAEFVGEEGESYVFRVRAKDKLDNQSDWVESLSYNIDWPRVVINEIAWAGTQASWNDEWMELYNVSNFSVDLSGWTLTDGNDIKINFSSSSDKIIPAHGFYLLERTSDQAVADVAADYIYKGSLKDSGEKLQLKDSHDRLVDEVDCSNKWWAGRNEYDRETMERKDTSVLGNLASNWQNTPPAVGIGHDSKNNIIVGTPKRPNSPLVYLNGTLDENRILTADLNPYFLGYLTIASGTILTMQPGVVILGGNFSTIEVRGELQALGAIDKKILLTAYGAPDYQDKYYFNDKHLSQIRFYPSSKGTFQNADFLSGNSNTDATKPTGIIYAEAAEIFLDGTKFVGDATMGDRYLAQFHNSQLSIINSSFQDNPLGIKIIGGSAVIKNSSWEKNGLMALQAEDVPSLTLENNIFKDNGWDYPNRQSWDRPQPLTSPVTLAGFWPSLKNNQWINNMINAPEWLGKLKASAIMNLAAETPLVVGNLEIPAGIQLEIESGSVLKMVSRVAINVFGSLKVLGAEGNPVVLTSLNDDTDGTDLDLGEPRDADPIGREWSQIHFDSRVTSTLNWAQIRYANDISSPQAAIYIKQTSVSFDHLTLENSRVPESAIYLDDASDVIITNSYIKNFSKPDINILSNSPAGIFINAGAPYLDNVMIDTFNYGLILRHGATPQFGPSGVQYQNVDLPLAY